MDHNQPPSPTSSEGHVNLAYENEKNGNGPRALSIISNGNLPNGNHARGSVDSAVVMSDSESLAELDPNSRETNQKYGRIAVQVDAARKKYGKETVLKDLYMTVQEGTIYGLLGSSGCGKTTILSCIVGLRKLDEGRISIFGKTPGHKDCGVPGSLVGYMPQEVALNGEFTMLEVCQYFGRLYGMDMDKVNDRVEYLVDLLDLKKCSGQLNNFSGGQKRRASFVVALLHEPDLLILDEPTVGVDPILRAKIWDHIRNLADKNGTTVIITTHYIEEMRQAERVGIMRGGQLMAEASPSKLLSFHKATMLEEVVLKYCLQTNAVEERAKKTSRPSKSTIPYDHEYSLGGNNRKGADKEMFQPHAHNLQGSHLAEHQHNTSQVNRIWALTRKNITVLMRNVGFLLFLLVVPSLLICFFAIAIGKTPQDLGIGFISDEIAGIDFCNEPPPISCSPEHLSCAYLHILGQFNIFNLYKYHNIDEALAAVDSRKTWGYIHFAQNFSKNIFHHTLGINSTEATIAGSKIHVRLDMTTISTGQIMKKLIFDAYRLFSDQLLTICDVDITGRDLPVVFEKPIYGNEDGKFTLFVIPGVAIGFLPFFSCVSCALSYIIEKKDGMIDRSKVAGVTAFDIMLSHAIPQFVIVIAQSIISFIIMYLVGIPFDLGSPFLAFVLTLFAAVTGMTMGFTAAEIFDEEKNAMLFAMAALFPSFLLSGLLWPLESVPSALRYVSLFLPATMPGESIRAILFRGWNLRYSTVYMGFVSQFIFIISFIAIIFLVHKIRN